MIISDAFISTCLWIKILFCINKELQANIGVPVSIQYENIYFPALCHFKIINLEQKLLVKSIRAISTVFPHGMAKYKQPFFMLFTSPCLALLILCILHRQYHYLMAKWLAESIEFRLGSLCEAGEVSAVLLFFMSRSLSAWHFIFIYKPIGHRLIAIFSISSEHSKILGRPFPFHESKIRITKIEIVQKKQIELIVFIYSLNYVPMDTFQNVQIDCLPYLISHLTISIRTTMGYLYIFTQINSFFNKGCRRIICCIEMLNYGRVIYNVILLSIKGQYGHVTIFQDAKLEFSETATLLSLTPLIPTPSQFLMHNPILAKFLRSKMRT